MTDGVAPGMMRAMTDIPNQVRLRHSDTWHPRDLPVLAEIAGIADNLGTVRPTGVADSTGLTEHDVRASIQALVHAGFLREDLKKRTYASNALYMTSPGWLIPSERGRREVGLWPSEETTLDLMVKHLEAIAANTAEDEDTRTRAKRVAESLLDGGRALGMSLATAIITGLVT